MKKSGFFKIAAIVAAATVGDGVFALPYVFYQSGWLLSLFYFVLLGTMVVAAHVLYAKTLEKVGEKERLLGLARKYLGEGGFWFGFVALVFGLLLTLVAYLILGAQFIHLAMPTTASSAMPLIIFWIFISLPVFLSDRHVVDLELMGIASTSSIIVLIFFSAWPNVTLTGVPAVNMENLFLPFGAILFSLAGWTSIEPAYESVKKARGSKKGLWKALAFGTIFAAALYAMFVAGILGSASQITPDTASGLMNWPGWKKDALAILGLLAVATVYLPISREIKNALEGDLGWHKLTSRAIILFAPLMLIALGLNNFLAVVGLVGGVFLSLQYLLIVSVGRHALKLSATRRFFLDLVSAIFILAAVYEVYVFIVR